MTATRLPLRFALDPDSPLDALEMVLAVARRLDLELASLHVLGQRVQLELRADDPDRLTLFHARLDNLIGVHDIVADVCILPIRQKYRTLRRSTDMQPERSPCNCNPPCWPAPSP